jgi:Acyclic terpene utilisation family protein AtuA
MAEPIRIANCSGFYGDRLSAAREMVEGGPIDALTGDWLAELTMLILARTRAKRPGGGFAGTFVTQMEQVMGVCLDRGIKVVSNAGGLDPAGCAAAVEEVAARLGLSPTVAYVGGDDLLHRLDELQAAGHDLRNLDTGQPLSELQAEILTANAYLSCWGIVDALDRGADIVVTGRVTDAGVTVGPAAWHHGWTADDLDPLAGAVVAGHVIECGAQATGGNYSFFTEIDDMVDIGFPWAEVAADGSSVIGKHDGTAGQVSIGTVTSQLLYEIGPPAYLSPDATARFDTIALEQVGPDRVRISGVKGEPPPPSLKVAMNYQGGYRNSMSIALTGLDIEAKADLIERAFWARVPHERSEFAQVATRLVRTDHTDPSSNESATAWLRVTVKDPDERKVGRAFANAGVEIGLATIPGLYGAGGPGAGQPYGVYWPTLVPSAEVPMDVVVAGQRSVVDHPRPGVGGGAAPQARESAPAPPVELPAAPGGPARPAPLGLVVGTRSGDKGGNANLGVFCRSAEAFAWLDGFLSVEMLQQLLPETAGLEVRRYALPNIWSLNFLVIGLLEEGVAASTRQDGQAKSLGEYLRARVVDIPEVLLS